MDFRPLSPHLSIYRVQISSFLSILHRFSELFIYALSMMIIIGVSACYHMGPWIRIHGGCWAWGVVAIIGMGLAYHVVSGVRYLLWDWGWGFSLAHVRATGWISLIVSALLGLVPIVVIWGSTSQQREGYHAIDEKLESPIL